jgi:hypothetical protein
MTQIKSKGRRAAIAKHARSAPNCRPSPVESKATSLWDKVHSLDPRNHRARDIDGRIYDLPTKTEG